MSTIHRRLAATAVAVSLAVSACSGSGTPSASPAASPTTTATPSPTPSQPPSPSSASATPDLAYLDELAAIVAATTTVESGRTDYEIGFEGSSVAPDGPLVSGTGEFVLGERQQARIDMDMSAAGLGVIEAIQDDLIFYMRGDAFEVWAPEGRWIRVDSTSEHPNVAMFSGTLAQSDPWASLYFLLGATAPPRELEPEVIDGERVRHLVLELDFDAAVERAPASARDYLLVQAEKFRGQGIAPAFTGEVWVDDAHLVRRVAYWLEMSALMGGGQMALRYDMSDFGADIVIDIPAPEAVVDIETLDLDP